MSAFSLPLSTFPFFSNYADKAVRAPMPRRYVTLTFSHTSIRPLSHGNGVDFDLLRRAELGAAIDGGIIEERRKLQRQRHRFLVCRAAGSLELECRDIAGCRDKVPREHDILIERKIRAFNPPRIVLRGRLSGANVSRESLCCGSR